MAERKIVRRYVAHPTISRFHHSKAFHRAIRGPRGSGKSTGCCIEVFENGRLQEPSPDGIRWTRWAIIRNTYRELLDTTVKTWLRWFPESHLGKFNYNNMCHHINWNGMNLEVMFRAMDRPSDIKKTLSMELTGAYINEAKEVPFGIISGLADAVGRFPEKDPAAGFYGPTQPGIIMDTNAPDDDHWWFRLDQQYRTGELDPHAWEFFTQPGGLIERDGKFYPNPEAENLDFIGNDYYTLRMVGKSPDHIRVYYCNQYGFVMEGKPVHPEYVDAVHTAEFDLAPIKGHTIYVGMDFGLTPAAVFGQVTATGRWQILDELVATRMGIRNFAREMKRFISDRYPDFKFKFGGDPSGSNEVETDEDTCFRVLAAAGIPAQPAYRNNDTSIRRGALQEPLQRMIDGKPGMLVSPRCKMLRKGLKGGFCYKRVQMAGSERYQDKPDKNMYSHVCEAAEYMCLTGGEGDQLVDGGREEVNTEKTFFRDYTFDHGNPSAGQGWMGA